MKKRLLALLATLTMLVAMFPSMAFAEESQVPTDAVAKVNGDYYNNLDAAIAAASENGTVLLLCDTTYTGATATYGGKALNINKKITFDLNDKTLTTSVPREGIRANGGCSIVNGTLVHTGGIAAIKAWNVDRIEDLEINVTKTGSTVGGIVLQEGTNIRVNLIKDTKILGATNGIETYNCGNAAQPVIGEMDNVTIEATKTGMSLSAPCGTAKNCNIYAKEIGIDMLRKGTYSVTLTLENCKVEGDVKAIYVHDEVFYHPTYKNEGKLELTIDDSTTLTSKTENPVDSEIGSKENAEITIEKEDGACAIVNENGTVKYYNEHTYVLDETTVVAPGCTTEGYTGDQKCECGTVKKGEAVQATGHNYVAGICSVCKAILPIETEVVDTVEKEDIVEEKIEVKEVTVVEDEHTVKAEASVSVEATEIVTAVVTEDKEAVEELVKGEVISKETAEKVKEAINNNEAVKTEIVVEEVKAEDITTEVQTAIAKEAVEEIHKEAKVAQFLDVSIFLKSAKTDKTLGTIDKLATPITITIAIPEDMQATGRVFYVIRNHDGVVEVLETTNNGNGTISFTTDQFSTYALAYKDAKAAPATGDGSAVMAYTVVAIAALAVVVVLKKRNYA